MRQMAAQRKGGPALETQDEDGPGATDDGNDATPDTVECPNCKTQFDEQTMKITKMGLPVVQDDAAPGGKDLSDLLGGSAEPQVGPKGSAYDGTIGTQAATSALAGLFGGHGGAGARL